MEKPSVGIIMGSDSDLPVMEDAAKQLEAFGIPYEITVMSAHRTPDRAAEYAKTAVERGLGVIIKSDALSGVDSLYSTVQMPPGVPVATVAINGAKNAAILAAQILATKDDSLRQKLVAYKKELNDKVLEKAEKMKQARTGV
jgi:5-(carboxyamino)imidazole ribonucleotide mutase